MTVILGKVATDDALPLKAARRDGVANVKPLIGPPDANDGVGQISFLPSKV